MTHIVNQIEEFWNIEFQSHRGLKCVGTNIYMIFSDSWWINNSATFWSHIVSHNVKDKNRWIPLLWFLTSVNNYLSPEIIYGLLFSAMAKGRLRIWRSKKVLSIGYFWLTITFYGFVVGTFKINLASYSLIEATSQNLSLSNRSSLSWEGFVIFFFLISTTG